MIDHAKPVRAGDELDVEAVHQFLRREIPELTAAPPEVTQFPGGASNLTYRLHYPCRDLVLRRPPPGQKAKSAHDMLRVYTHLKRGNQTLVGPNCPGIITPGVASVGIMPTQVFTPGRVGLLSRSGTLTYQISKELALFGIGQSTVVGIGGDPVIGSSFIDILSRFEADPDTDASVIYGEPGGSHEAEVVAAIREGALRKPIVAIVVGAFQERYPKGASFGHVAAMIS